MVVPFLKLLVEKMMRLIARLFSLAWEHYIAWALRCLADGVHNALHLSQLWHESAHEVCMCACAEALGFFWKDVGGALLA